MNEVIGKMRIISEKTLFDYAKDHADFLNPIKDWIAKVNQSKWKNFTEVKNTFNSADYIGNDRIVFDIKGNSYRVVALVFYFPPGLVYIRFVGTHPEYDKINDCSVL